MVELTALRDRDALRQRLIDALADALVPLGWRLLQRDSDQPDTWRVVQAGPRSGAAPTWSGLEAARHLAGQGVSPVLPLDRPRLAIFALTDLQGVDELLEFDLAGPLEATPRQIAELLLRQHAHLCGLLDYGECDELTGLLNRKTFDESFMKLGLVPFDGLDLALPADERRGHPARDAHWLAVVDVDHFKAVNDSFGHLVGDEVLLLLARLMRDTFRAQDRLYRFGGEEFVALLRCPTAEAANCAFERLRGRVAGHDFPQAGRITISVGYTRVDPDDTPESAFERADQSVYQAKQDGRNRVLEHAALVASGALAAQVRRGGVDFF